MTGWTASYAMKKRRPKTENLLNRREVRDVEGKGDRGEERCGDTRWRSLNHQKRRKRTKRNSSNAIYSANPPKTQVGSRPRDGRRGAVRDACYMERWSFEHLTSAEGEWVIRESSAVRFGCMSRATRLLVGWLQLGSNED